MYPQAVAEPSAATNHINHAVRSWTNQLVDIGGRNRLLYFRHLKRGTLDFGRADSADQSVVHDLLSGVEIRLSDYFPADVGVSATHRARWIYRKAREHEEERGIRTLYLGYGFAGWRPSGPGPTPNAPLLLGAAELTPVGRAADDMILRVVDNWEMNPSLIQLFKQDYDVLLEQDRQEQLLDSEPLDLEAILAELRNHYAAIPDFTTSDGLVLGTFFYAKLPMVRDLEGAESAIAQHPIVAAIAGDEDAQAQLRESQHHGDADGEIASGDRLPPRDEFLILDADSTQSEVINAALSGRSLVVVGPPGTGKSQTIANLLAASAAHGKSTLFVAEKRAAIEAVLKHLHAVGLGDLLLDLHEGINRRQTAEQLAAALETAHTTYAPDVEQTQRSLVRNRRKLAEAANELHLRRDPWGLSIYQLQTRILETNDMPDALRLLSGRSLRALAGETLEQASDDLCEYVNLGGPRLDRDDKPDSDAPWHCAYRRWRITSDQQAATAAQLLDELRDELLPDCSHRFGELAQRLCVTAPATIAECRSFLAVLDNFGLSREHFTADIFEVGLDQLADSLLPAESRWHKRLVAHIFNSEYRRAKAQAQALLRTDFAAQTPAQTRRQLLELLAASDEWRSETGTELTSLEHVDAELTASRQALSKLSEALSQFHTLAALDDEDTSNLDWDAHHKQLDRFHEQRDLLRLLPRLHELRSSLDKHGIAYFAQVTEQRGWDNAQVARAFKAIWARSVLAEVLPTAHVLASFNAAAHAATVNDFRDADRCHIKSAPQRIRRAWAEASVAARDQHPQQTQLILREARKKRRHIPIRELFANASDVLTALKPCWVMSPLVVPQVFPIGGQPLFDVVIFDEASQIAPADAISSLLRGRQAIVVGDPKQLPPTSFFTGSNEDDDTPEELPTQDVESILDAMSTLLTRPRGAKWLGWHYRSRDERLIAFSNQHVYDGSLTTFPGAIPDDCLQHVEVPFTPGASEVLSSYSPEVERVVELILEHAETRPRESLGVIALGLKHAERIEELLRRSVRARADLDEFFDETKPEPFFVKNLERVQGDERDAIILSVGYSRNADGRMRYQFGPINREGGFRRLNVAVTRAKRRMTIVSCFAAEDMAPERIRGEGVQMLRDYIAYAASGGRQLSRSAERPPLNPFEIDIKQALEAHGMKLDPQYGVSGYWIDFAVMHPERPAQPILAIEADGAQYHSAYSTRDRDRLRQSHLERLGWSFHRIWSTAWFQHREEEIEKALAAWRSAVARADIGRDPLPAAPTKPLVPQPTQHLPSITPRRRAPRPSLLSPGTPINAYQQYALINLVRWIESDGLLRTEEELIQECCRELGYRRRGKRIVSALKSAIAAARAL